MSGTKFAMIGVCWALVSGCQRQEAAFAAPHTYQLQGTAVLSVGPPDDLCGAAASEAPSGTTPYVMQPPNAIDFSASISAEKDGTFLLADGSGCDLIVDANEARDRLSATDRACTLAENSSLRTWGITERTYRFFVLDFTQLTWRQSMRSLAVDNTGQPNVQCVVGEGVILGAAP